MSSSPDNIYLDLSTVNSDNLGGGVKRSLQFNENRTNPILNNPSNYFLSVVRFSVDTPGVSLPLFIPKLLIDGVNDDVNRTCYTITLTMHSNGVLNNVLTGNVIWSPEDKSASAPKNTILINPTTSQPYISTQDITTGYYSAYSARWWLACINSTLNSLWIQTGSVSPSPTFIIDAHTNLISLITPNVTASAMDYPDDTLNGIGPSPTYTISPIYLNSNVIYNLWFNEPMYNLLCSLPSVYYGNTLNQTNFDNNSNSIINGRYYLFNYLITPINYNEQNIITLNTPPQKWVSTTSEYSPVPMWNPIQSVLFSSSLLPVYTNNSSPPSVFNSNTYDSTFINNGQNSNKDNSISDIQVGLVSGSEYKPNILYVPSSQYRLIDLLGTNPIFQVSFEISWKTKFGQVLPFRLSSQCGANLKILFVRKRMYLANLPPYDTN